jgi:hypothetical protein
MTALVSRDAQRSACDEALRCASRLTEIAIMDKAFGFSQEFGL